MIRLMKRFKTTWKPLFRACSIIRVMTHLKSKKQISIGDRNIRLIDIPGLGNTNGVEQDNKNLLEILTYVSHYEHLDQMTHA